jgi:DNA-directed RNA polymerase specialized sigma24 family protein
MSYNYRKEYAKWKRWKDQEERILKQMNMPKNKINELREFDWAQFNDERRFTRKQSITNDQYFALIPVNEKKEFKNINDILDTIEDEALYEYLKDEEPVLLTVILLKIQGFSIKEISKVINMPISTIYRKIEKIKRNFQ